MKKLLSLLLCSPKVISEAINVAEDPSEFDELLLRKAGFGG